MVLQINSFIQMSVFGWFSAQIQTGVHRLTAAPVSNISSLISGDKQFILIQPVKALKSMISSGVTQISAKLFQAWHLQFDIDSYILKSKLIIHEYPTLRSDIVHLINLRYLWSISSMPFLIYIRFRLAAHH